MKIKDKELWQQWQDNNTDFYGATCVKYAESWANLMEYRIQDGATIGDVAQETSHEANTMGISGAMYGAAVAILASVWEYGEELRRWHNIDIQIGDEGERANDSGGVLDPSVLNIG